MLRLLASSTVEAGLQVDVATTDDDGHERMGLTSYRMVLENGVTYHYFPRQTRFYSFSWPLTRWLGKHVRDYDVVHIHALFSYAAMPAAFYAKRAGVPYIVRPLGVLNRWGIQNRRPWLKRLSFWMIEKRILASAVGVHYTSAQEQIEAEELGVNSKGIIIPNAVDNLPLSGSEITGQFRARHAQASGRVIVLFLSRVDKKKGLDLLLTAFARIKDQCPHALLVIAGTGNPGFIAELEQQATRLKIAKDVLWTGFLSGRGKDSAFVDADVFVLPSYSENFGVAIVEAMAAGLPVIISDRVGIHEEIANGNAGIITSCDVDSLANALIRLILQPELRHRFGENGRTLAKEMFSVNAVTKQLLKAYNDVTRHELRPSY